MRGMEQEVQEVQEVKNLVDRYQQYFSDYLPGLTRFGLKVKEKVIYSFALQKGIWL